MLFNNQKNHVVYDYELQLEQFVSSCEIDTEWRRGGEEIGLMIKSWIQSIVATSGNQVPKTKVSMDEKRSRVMEVGNYSEGKLDGLAWKRYCHDCHDQEVIHDGWLYGRANRGEMNGSNIVYLYQDLYTVLIGQFEKGKMVQAKEELVAAHQKADVDGSSAAFQLQDMQQELLAARQVIIQRDQELATQQNGFASLESERSLHKQEEYARNESKKSNKKSKTSKQRGIKTKK